jgi:hypothetical protein
MKRMTRRAQRPEEIHHLGDDFDQGVSSLRAGFAYSWSGGELKRLRVEADISLDQQAIAMGISVRGLRSLEGRQHVTAGLVDRYRAGLNRIDAIAIEDSHSPEPVDEVPPLVPVPSSAKSASGDRGDNGI